MRTGASPVSDHQVTISELDDKLNLVRSEQKGEHLKTRALIIILAVPQIGKIAPLLGSSLPGWWPW